ncbi:MAG: ATP-binding protein [Paludibacteraceae bacterium]|nr:ATP-binding protein [Paludibacteraceae bacterium]
MVAAPTIQHEDNSIMHVDTDLDLLKIVAVYGANASGKTKLFQAYRFMGKMVCDLATNNKSNWQEEYVPYLLDKDSYKATSSFEASFLMDGIIYRYGYTIDAHKVVEEWLYRQKGEKNTEIFYRDVTGTHYNKTYVRPEVIEPLKKQKMLRDDTLLLAVLAIWNHVLARKVVSCFFNTNVLSSTAGTGMTGFSIKSLASPMKNNIIRFMKSADINIEDMSLREMDVESLPEEVKMYISKDNKRANKYIDGVNTLHKVYDENGISDAFVRFSLENDESYGTYRLFALSAPIIDTLRYGRILFVDEIDNGLHPDILKAIVTLFNTSEINHNNAQLIINTHNIDLLDDMHLFKQDQVYVTEKDRFGEARLEPMLKYALNSEVSLGQLYREGRLGGVPYLARFMNNVLIGMNE